MHLSKLLLIIPLALLFSCTNNDPIQPLKNNLLANVLDYSGTPDSLHDRELLAFSDQGAWFGYALPADGKYYGGFTGPFIMTQENGVWISPNLSQLNILIDDKLVELKNFSHSSESFSSHLSQTDSSYRLVVAQTLFYPTPHTAVIATVLSNPHTEPITIQPAWNGSLFANNIRIEKEKRGISLHSDKSTAIGHLEVLLDSISGFNISDTSYALRLAPITLEPSESKELILTHSFIFPEYSWQEEKKTIQNLPQNWRKLLQERVNEKEEELRAFNTKLDKHWHNKIYQRLIAKAQLTLQNNWRVAAGELKHSGLFPSYHYEWFNGFWAWDSWKHAAALAYYNPELAKEQIRAMYAFETAEGFIPDCVFRDTTIEQHNYRNTKPPLSGWAVWEIFKQDADTSFIKEMYPKLVRQHNWWYKNRDHDRDSLCEYGSTDGNLLPAKWESGMDNAVRFDNTQLLKNHEGAYSMDQESVDLNAYLFAEKGYISQMAEVLGLRDDKLRFENESALLKEKIQQQFYDPESGWFYDTSIDGQEFVKIMGCEGWIPLWTNIASKTQAETVKTIMLNPNYFNTTVPLPTLNVRHPDFKPVDSYWRGEVWLDQAYFGISGLKHYGYTEDANQLAYKLMHNGRGVLKFGDPIRENYNPLGGRGLDAVNFSWSAAHYLLLLVDE